MAGIEIPRTTAAQWRRGRAPGRRNLLPGDLLFFVPGDREDRHVGIYEGNGMFIHASSSGKPVGRASLDNPYWRSRLIGSRSFFISLRIQPGRLIDEPGEMALDIDMPFTIGNPDALDVRDVLGAVHQMHMAGFDPGQAKRIEAARVTSGS